MLWHNHSELIGKHALVLSPSKHSWLNYDEENLYLAFRKSYATQAGTAMHDFASHLINHKMRLNNSDKKLLRFYLEEHNIPLTAILDYDLTFSNIANFVNDAITFKMKSEMPLIYISDETVGSNCFGTADAISFGYNKKIQSDLLRIHDLKTGYTPASIDQLMIYAALFCLEYKVKPSEIVIELRLYQGGEINACIPDPEDIHKIIDTIIRYSNLIDQWRLEGGID